MVELKVCGWGASARGNGERSELAAGRPRKEQAPKALSRIASYPIINEILTRKNAHFFKPCIQEKATTKNVHFLDPIIHIVVDLY